jgi:hypothetical protein
MIHPDAKVLARGCYRFRGVVREVVLHEEPQGDQCAYLVRSVVANTEGPNRVHCVTDGKIEALAVFNELVNVDQEI